MCRSSDFHFLHYLHSMLDLGTLRRAPAILGIGSTLVLGIRREMTPWRVSLEAGQHPWACSSRSQQPGFPSGDGTMSTNRSSEGHPAGGSRGRVGQESRPSPVPPFVRHTPAGRRAGHPHRAGTPRPQGHSHDDDRHPRAHPRRTRRPQPGLTGCRRHLRDRMKQPITHQKGGKNRAIR